MLQFDRVREVADAIAAVATAQAELLAEVNKVLELNADVSVPWSALAGKAFAANNTTDVLTAVGHGMTNGTRVRVRASTGGALPTGLAADTDYYVIAAAADTFQLSAALGGAAVNFTTNGAGTLTAYPLPDYMQVEANGNLSGRTFDPAQVSNAVGSLDWVRKLLTNQAMTGSQGDHLGNLNQLARAQG